jgi:hypothetical protein
MHRSLIALPLLLAALLPTAAVASEAWPPIVHKLIAEQMAAPKKNPPGSVWQYRYKGEAVYYVPPSCCDVPGQLYASDGRVICAPDGGITGGGVGKGPDFFDSRTDEQLLWADAR